MGSLLETMYDLLLKPQKAMPEIMQAKSLKQSWLVVLFCTILTTWGGLTTGIFNGTSQIIIVFFDYWPMRRLGLLVSSSIPSRGRKLRRMGVPSNGNSARI